MIKTEINNQCMRKLKGNFKISTVVYPFLVEGYRAELEKLFLLTFLFYSINIIYI